MKNIKILMAIAVLALLVLSLCACGNNKPDINETQPISADVSVTATETNAINTAPSGAESEISQGENDLELITVPQEYNSNVTNNTNAPDNTEAIEAETETQPDTSAAEATTEAQAIELPFVPAN